MATRNSRPHTADADDGVTLTKAELAERLFDRIGFNKRESKDIVDAFFDLIAERLIAGEDVRIAGFGQFQVRDKPPRPGRNPRTGELVPIEARRVVTFHASPKLKEALQVGAPDASDADR
ncbi:MULTISPECIES: integration host factor subunit alpha [unclassified Tepidimonas]|jgi:integration host factor subunit alpha|uniref:integration host factor subunit alpha n=1 Tax=unclassified Tepidimonas TaxID=2631705 RepID=UPI003C79EC52